LENGAVNFPQRLRPDEGPGHCRAAGTNPIACYCPAGADSFQLDMATPPPTTSPGSVRWGSVGSAGDLVDLPPPKPGVIINPFCYHLKSHLLLAWPPSAVLLTGKKRTFRKMVPCHSLCDTGRYLDMGLFDGQTVGLRPTPPPQRGGRCCPRLVFLYVKSKLGLQESKCGNCFSRSLLGVNAMAVICFEKEISWH